MSDHYDCGRRLHAKDAEISALKADLDKAAAANVNLAQTAVELRDDIAALTNAFAASEAHLLKEAEARDKEIAALKAKVERLVEAGDAAANFWPGHTHGMMGKSPGHRCERCERVAAWAAAKEAP